MNFTLDTFRNNFWNIATVLAVVVAVLIGTSFIIQIRESVGITFGKLPITELVGVPFNKEFTFNIKDTDEPNKAKVALLATEEGSLKKAEFLAKVLKINGKPNKAKENGGESFIEIKDKAGFLTYYLSDGRWNYSGSFNTGKKSMKSANDAREAVIGFLKRLNLNKEVIEVKVKSIDSKAEWSVSLEEKNTTHFSLEHSPQFEGKNIFGVSFNSLMTVLISKKGIITSASYNPVRIDESSIGEYPVLKLKDVKKKLETGKGTVVFEDIRFRVNLNDVSSVKFTDVRLEYIADETNSLVIPFWVLEGKTEGSDNSQEVTVLVNAIVDKYLKE